MAISEEEVNDLLWYVQVQNQKALTIIRELEERELEGIGFAKELNRVRKEWLKDRNEANSLRFLVSRYEDDIIAAENRENNSNLRLNEARHQITILNRQLLRAKSDLQNNEEVVELVRQILNDEKRQSIIHEDARRTLQRFQQRYSNAKLTFNLLSTVSDVDISYDQSDPSVGHDGQQNSSAPTQNDHGVLEPPVQPGAQPDVLEEPLKSKSNARRSLSDTFIICTCHAHPEQHQPTSGAAAISQAFFPVSKVGHIHFWGDQKTAFKAVYCEQCHHAGQKDCRIRFAGKYFKCNNCAVIVCFKCFNVVSLPCIPKSSTSHKGQRGDLCEFVNSLNRPKVPHVLIILINEIEKRGVDSVEGLYGIIGNKRQVDKLVSEFLWGKMTPNICQVNDIHTLTNCVLQFLSSDVLRQPVIPHSDWHDFVRASENSNVAGGIDSCITGLPTPNRDTLAFMIEHLHRVAQASQKNYMSVDSLADIFGPILMGNSCEFPKKELIWQECDKAKQVIIGMLNQPNGHWTQFLEQCVKANGPFGLTSFTHYRGRTLAKNSRSEVHRNRIQPSSAPAAALHHGTSPTNLNCPAGARTRFLFEEPYARTRGLTNRPCDLETGILT